MTPFRKTAVEFGRDINSITDWRIIMRFQTSQLENYLVYPECDFSFKNFQDLANTKDIDSTKGSAFIYETEACIPLDIVDYHDIDIMVYFRGIHDDDEIKSARSRYFDIGKCIFNTQFDETDIMDRNWWQKNAPELLIC